MASGEVVPFPLPPPPDDRHFRLTLFVSGAAPRSALAVLHLRELCQTHLAGRYQLDIVDIHQEPARLVGRPVLALPTLVREEPLPVRMIAGDLSDRHRVLRALDVELTGTATGD